MTIELVTLTTQDGIELDGALYRPADTPPKPAASILMIHGLTWNFYRGPSRWLPPLLAAAGFPCLSLNMRDHDLKEPKDFSLAHRDLRAGIDHLEGEGGEVVVLAHGFACNKLVCYAASSGDDRPRRQILTTFGAVKAYRPEIWSMVMASAQGMRGAMLVVQGAVDPEIEPRARADELVAAATGSRVDVELLVGGDHYFNNRHAELAQAITAWLGKTSLGAP